MVFFSVSIPKHLHGLEILNLFIYLFIYLVIYLFILTMNFFNDGLILESIH